ncbi:hypothetical protein AHAS_Ahas15G0215000 [Arachis hypogaea]
MKFLLANQREDEEKKKFTIINPSSTTELPISMRGNLATQSSRKILPRGISTPSTPSGTPSLCFGLFCTLAFHTQMLKRHAQVRVEAWRATPYCSSGTPSLFSLQLPLWNFVPACHAKLLKWHAHSFVSFLAWRATPGSSSDTLK